MSVKKWMLQPVRLCKSGCILAQGEPAIKFWSF